MTEITPTDIIFVFLMLLFIEWQTMKICRRTPPLRNLFGIISFGIFLWFCFGFFHDEISTNIFGLSLADTLSHDINARYIQGQFSLGNFSGVFHEYIFVGNSAYNIFVGAFYYITGTSYQSIILFNALMAAWGGMILLETIVRYFDLVRAPKWLLLFTVFLPSLIFWTTSNLKEGLMFWAICNIVRIIRIKREPLTTKILFGFLAGAMVAIIFRPHIAAIWLGSTTSTFIVSGRKKYYAIPVIVLTLLATIILRPYAGWDDETSAMEVMDLNYQRQINRGEGGSTGATGSTVATSPNPILIFSGISMLLMRPFLWEIDSFKYLLTSLEVWTIFFLIILGWMKYRKKRMRTIADTPILVLSVLVIGMFSIMYSFMANLGLVARQRLQAMPAIIVIMIFPLLQKYMKRNFAAFRKLK